MRLFASLPMAPAASLVAALASALLLPAVQPLLLGTAGAAGMLLVSEAAAQAQSAEAVARVSEAITVRLEGVGSPGSGVLVRREGNRYTVLTAWHVVSAQNPGEELDVITPDGKRYPLEQGSIQRLDQVDLAVLTFSSPQSYKTALIGETRSVSSGSPVYVAGFPLPTSAVPSRIWRFLRGNVIANATVAIPNGYQLLYDNPTLPGMSGGPVLNGQGQLVGIHASAERADQISERTGKAVATGTNQAVPIDYYRQWSSGAAVVAASAQATTADDYLAQAKELLGQKGKEQEVIRLSTQALAVKASAEAYFYRAYAKSDLGDKQGAIADYNQALAINSLSADAYGNRGVVKSRLGDKQGAIADFNQVLAINPQDTLAYINRGVAKAQLGDKQGAIADFNKALSINPQDAVAYINRGITKAQLGDKQGAIADFNEALSINPQDAVAYNNRGLSKAQLGDIQGAIADYNQALAIIPQYELGYYNRGLAKSDLGDQIGACEDMTKSASLGSSVAQELLPQICQ